MLALTNDTVVSFVFAPSNITIHPGDSITWTNGHAQQTHDSTAGPPDSGTNNGWASPLLFLGGGTFAFTFTNVAAYPYRCKRHADALSNPFHPEQTGMVSVVTASNSPPGVAITNPLSGAAFRVNESVGVNVSASDSDGTVTLVELLTNGVPVGSLVSNFNFSIAFSQAANYTLTARATDNGGLTSTSTAVNIFILTNALLTNLLTLTNGQAQFSVIGIKDQTYFFDATTDLSNWLPFATNVAPGDLFNVIDPGAATNARRFYRGRQQSSQ